MLERVKEILHAEAEAIQSIPISPEIERAITTIMSCKGKLFTTGIGKAGYVARKAASTFCTTGTPSVFVHPGDARHGDVGVITPHDILLAYSNSGKTREVLEIVEFTKHLGVHAIIAVCASKASPLGELCDIVLEIGDIKEPCPLGLTPSASTSAMTALSDAIALVIMGELKFTAADFAARHHGGYLGGKSRGDGAVN
ncbi:MAG: SIS domain-containing protein [Bdellovibrionales bacterium]|nr:SIS domain-containing protein [Bdellovibrionales bacterium]